MKKLLILLLFTNLNPTTTNFSVKNNLNAPISATLTYANLSFAQGAITVLVNAQYLIRDIGKIKTIEKTIPAKKSVLFKLKSTSELPGTLATPIYMTVKYNNLSYHLLLTHCDQRYGKFYDININPSPNGIKWNWSKTNIPKKNNTSNNDTYIQDLKNSERAMLTWAHKVSSSKNAFVKMNKYNILSKERAVAGKRFQKLKDADYKAYDVYTDKTRIHQRTNDDRIDGNQWIYVNPES